ncbi:MAG: M16 family metallopeptidase, partial [Flavobacteriaceae bacterium]
MKKIILFLLIGLLFIQCQIGEKHVTKTFYSNGISYERVTNDPTNTRIYTLDNGLKVYLSKFEDAPRIQVFTAFKAGGKNDPADNTGLAHYLEHIMFKGTDVFGTKDYDKEEILLDSIEQLFNQYGKITDPKKRKDIYSTIDVVSNKAAQYAIPNEYDKMISLLGGKRLNAYTTYDRTVYTVDIPSNELERFLTLEGLRFKKIVNRLFHTELETVYEEKNRALDSDYRKSFEAMNKALFSEHPYGKQSVLGTVEHLKNPSITEIKKYFNTYYRPNNAAICMSGDLDFDKTIALIQEHFGDWAPNDELPVWEKAYEAPLTQPKEVEIFGPQEERISIGFRFDGTHSVDYKKVVLIDMILNNASAGLIDLNLMQKQKVLTAGSFVNDMNDYSIHNFYGTPKAGQTLSEVKTLILAQIDSVKQGAFDSWLLEAVVNDLKKSEMEKDDSEYANYYRANSMVMAFTNDTPWIDQVTYYSDLSKITKEELVSFANTHYTDNYVVVNKRNGKDPNLKKVEKPQITKVPLNRDIRSVFHEQLANIEVQKLEPKYLDFQKDLDHFTIGTTPVIYKKNEANDLFELSYVFEFGNNADP